MNFSLPRYRRLSEEDLARLDKDDPRNPSHRLQSALLKILLLAGLWGLPFYSRSVVLSAIDEKRASETVVGKWRTTNGSHFQIAFTLDGQFVLSWKETIVVTARYWFHEGDENEIVLSEFRKLDERVEKGTVTESEMCWFRASWAKGKLSTTPVFNRESDRDRPGAWWRIGGESLSFSTAVLERID